MNLNLLAFSGRLSEPRGAVDEFGFCWYSPQCSWSFSDSRQMQSNENDRTNAHWIFPPLLDSAPRAIAWQRRQMCVPSTVSTVEVFGARLPTDLTGIVVRTKRCRSYRQWSSCKSLNIFLMRRSTNNCHTGTIVAQERLHNDLCHEQAQWQRPMLQWRVSDLILCWFAIETVLKFAARKTRGK
jgi:hypothetical protein